MMYRRLVCIFATQVPSLCPSLPAAIPSASFKTDQHRKGPSMLQSLWTWPRLVVVVVCILLTLGSVLAGAIAFGTAAPPRPVQPRRIDLTELPPLSRYTARDGTLLAYRAYPGGGEQVAVLIHGSGTESSVMNALAKALHASGATVYHPTCAAMAVPASAATLTTLASSTTISRISLRPSAPIMPMRR
jgi:hypothetical protein